MKKVLLIVWISMFGITVYGQTPAEKKADKIDLDNIKRLYTRLKTYKIDVKTELLWQYTYEDSTETSLKTLAETFEKGGLEPNEISPSKGSNKTFMLTVTEVKKYSDPEDMHKRVKHLNEVALVHKIMSPYAIIGAEKPAKEGEIGSYKKVGVGKSGVPTFNRTEKLRREAN